MPTEDIVCDIDYLVSLFERSRIAREGINKINEVKNKLVSDFGVTDQSQPNYLRERGKLAARSAHESLEQLLNLQPPTPPKPFGIDSKNWPNYFANNCSLDEKELTDQGSASIEKNQKASKNVHKIIWATETQTTRELLSPEPQPSTSAAARDLNRLNYSTKRKRDNDDQEMMDAGAVSIESNQTEMEQKEHSENAKNTKVNVKPYFTLIVTLPSGRKQKFLVTKSQQFNATFHVICENTTESQINNDDQIHQELKDGGDLSIKHRPHLNPDIRKIIETIIMKLNMQLNNCNAWLRSDVALHKHLEDSEPQPSTSTGAISLKREISNDVQDYQTQPKNLSIKESNQAIANIIPKPNGTNVSLKESINKSLEEAIRSIQELWDSEPQPSTSKAAIYLKREISNDVVNYGKSSVGEDVSIKGDQLLNDDPKITDNTVILIPIDTDVNTHTCSSNTFKTAACTTRQTISPEPQPSSYTAAKSIKRTKRKATNESLDEKDVSTENIQQQEYPKRTDKSVILGPNGTEVTLQAYDTIIWTTAAAATRQLLGFVFSNDVLATHTLTGKPSPAFYGRERPEKMQLDPEKIADIIHCIRTHKDCTERDVRAAITTKCSDTSKKYKRHSLKQSKLTPSS